MKKVAYTTKTGLQQFRPVFNKAYQRAAEESTDGFCLACGSTQSGCEPDARGYKCESCDAMKVFGLEELVLMGLAR